MFNKVRDKIRYLIMGIGTAILAFSFFIIYAILRSNIEFTSRDVLNEAIEIVVTSSDINEYKETEVMIFKIEEDTMLQYNDNYKRYSEKVLKKLYIECKRLKSNPVSIGINSFYYNVIDLGGEYVYFVYDASLAMNNLNLLLFTLATFFIILIIIIGIVACYLSNQIIDPLETTYVKQKEFIENASHELKTPLSIINANIDSISNIDEENIKWISNIKDQIERMNKLVIEILELFRIESANSKNEIDINLTNYLRKTILSFEVLTYEKNIELKQTIEDNIIIKAEENKIDKMINILLDNALKYVKEKGYIDIQLKKDKKKIVLIVENSGGNLEQEDLDKIFERFYKKNEEDKNSFGLGLAILDAIVKSLNGEIKVECEKDIYTRFILKF